MVAHFNTAVLGSYTAGADLSLLQYTFVKFNASGQVIPVAAATDIAAGVLQNNPKSAQEAVVLVVGGSKLIASAAISLPALIGTTATGTAVKLAAGTDTTKYVFATAEGAPGVAAATGDVITVFVNCATPARAA